MKKLRESNFFIMTPLTSEYDIRFIGKSLLRRSYDITVVRMINHRDIV